jgi:segregation and condensation protein A
MPLPGHTRRADAAITARRDVLPSRLGAAPKVEFSGGASESATHIRLEDFDGPIALLLAVIEARQLDVLTVPLGAMAEAYLDALAALDGDRLGNVSAFVAVAAQLILLKSRAMLPRQPKPSAVALDDEPDPEAELRARLIEYRRFRDAGQVLATRADLGRLFRRDAELAASTGRASARPPERPPLSPVLLPAALDRLAILIPEVASPTEIVARVVTLSERTAIIRAALRNADCIVLQDLLVGVRDRVVVAVTFLAMLELSKRREISLEQQVPWGPIVARRLAGAVETQAEVDESLGSFA